MKTYEQMEEGMGDYSLVSFSNTTPHCVKHGAMLKVSRFEDGGGYWRCISVVSGGEFTGEKMNDNVCRAACVEKRNEEE